MSGPTVREGRRPTGVRVLLPVFARTRGSWWSGLAAAVAAAVNKAGASDSAVSLYVPDIGQAAGPVHGDVRYQELDLATRPTSAVRLQSGSVPSTPGQACVSPAPADRRGSPTKMGFFDGALSLRIICVADDDQSRDVPAVYAAPGTWDAAGAGLSEDALRRWGVTATANVYWSGGDATAVDAALSAVL